MRTNFKSRPEPAEGNRATLMLATISVIAVIVVGFLLPAIAIFAYRYTKRRWLGAP